MVYNWPKFVAKMVLYALIAAMIFMLIVWAVVMIQANNIMTEAIDDLVFIVSEENCLSTDGDYSTYEMFCERLEASESSWLTFDTEGENAIEVVAVSNGQPCLSYTQAPQRGAMIKCKIIGKLELPVMIAPMGQDRLTVEIDPYEKEFTTMAMKFYKDK